MPKLINNINERVVDNLISQLSTQFKVFIAADSIYLPFSLNEDYIGSITFTENLAKRDYHNEK